MTHKFRPQRILALAVLFSAIAACGGGGIAEDAEPQSGVGSNAAPATATAAATAPAPAPVPGAYDTSARVAAFNARVASLRGSSPLASHALPAAPTITSRRTVSNAAEMQAAASVPGVEVTFAGSGFTGTLAPRASDQRWIFPAGFTLTGAGTVIDHGPAGLARRIELVGTGGRAVGDTYGQPTDLRMTGMEIRTSSSGSHQLARCDRVLIEGSYLFAHSYAIIYSDCNNVTFANTEFHSGGAHATTRGARNGTTLMMDSRLRTDGSQQQIRMHAGSQYFGVFNNQIEGGTASAFSPAGDPCPAVQNLLMLDNSYYGQGDTIWIDSGCVAGGTIVGNRGFSPWGSGSQISVNMPAGSVVRDNPRLPYQTPPAWQRK